MIPGDLKPGGGLAERKLGVPKALDIVSICNYVKFHMKPRRKPVATYEPPARQPAAVVQEIATRAYGAPRLIALIEAGLPIEELDALRAHLDLPMDRLAPRLGLSKATLHRRRAGGRLDPAESDRVVRYARLLGRAVEVLESEENARQWLQSPQAGLGGAIPLDYAMTEVGGREVEDLLLRIEYGVYS